LSDAAARKFVGECPTRENLFDFDNPKTFGAFANPDYFFEAKRGQFEAFENSRKIITQAGAKFDKKYSSPIEKFKTKDAEIILIIIGSAFGAAKIAANNLRKKGKKVGIIRVRTFRPFPEKEILESSKSAKKIGILDRMIPLGSKGGVLFNEINSALFSIKSKIETANFIFGIGQRQFNPNHAEEIFNDLAKKKLPQINFVNLRE
jgi:pyruvate ferredoxin oxidoreductase alpha subunit